MAKVQISLRLALLVASFLCLGGVGSVENSTPTATTAAKTKTSTAKTTTTSTTTVRTVTKNVQRNANTLTSTTKPEPSAVVVENNGNGTRITRQLQYLYSPYLFPSSTNPAQANYNVNYPVGSAPQQFSAPGQAPHSPYYAFWSNLQTIPAHPQPSQQQVRKTVNGQPVAVTSQSQSQQQQQQQQQLFQLVPQFHLVSPYNLGGGPNVTGSGSGSGSVQPQSAATNQQIRTVALPYSQVEHGNIWNFDDSMRPNPQVAVAAPMSHPVADQSGSQSPKRNVSPVNFYFPFANAQFGVALDQMFEKESAASGYASSSGSSSGSGSGLRTGSAGSSSGFQRGHIESRPGVGSPLYHSAHNVGAAGGGTKYSNTVKNTGIGGFNRAHVEAPPSTNNNNHNRNNHNGNYYNSLSNRHHGHGHGSHQEVRGEQEEEAPAQVSFNRGAVEGAPEGFRTQSPHRGKNIDEGDNSNSYGTDDAFIIQTGEKDEFQNQNGDFRRNYHNVNVRQGDKKVVCYFANWAWYRKGKVSFLPEHIDPMLCTHVIYAFSTFDKAKTSIAPSDVWTDVTNNFYRRTVALKEKNPNLKVLLSIGGWADSGDDKYSKLAHSPSARVKFAEEAVQFLGMYGFDGLAVDWHYPKCWQSNCDAGPGTDSTAFGDLLRVLKQYFAPRGLLLSATLSGYKEVIDLAYHVPTLNELLDLMNVMVYDYHGAWEQTTGHVAPLFYGPAGYDHYPFYNANFTMEYYVSLGADRSKLIMGIPMYGQTFTLAERINTQVGAEAIGPGDAGEYTQQPGMLAYYEICKRVREKGWTVVNDRTASWGPIAYSGNQWVGYDDATFVARKARYIQSKGFGGAFVWTMDLDDFNNDCCSGPQPLLRTIASELLNIPYKHRQGDCTAPSPPMAPPVVVTTTFPSNRPSTPSSSSHEHEHTTSSVWWRPTTTTTDKPIIWWTSSPATVPTSTTTGQPSTVTWWPTKPTTTTTTTTTTTPRSTTTYFTTTTTTTTIRPSMTTTQKPMPTRPTTTEPPRTTIVLTCHHQVNPVMEQNNMTSMAPEPSSVPSVPINQEDLFPGAPCHSSTFTIEAARDDCATYFQCVYDKITVRKCSAGLHYNAMAQTCDWPDNAQCQREPPPSMGVTTTSTTMYPRPTTTVTTAHTGTTPRPTTTTMRPSSTWAPSGDCRDGEYLPGEDCSSYYLCTNGRKTLQRCGPGLHWDRTRKLCDWPSEAHCETKVHKLDVGSGDLTIRQQPCAEGSFQPSKTDCSMYYVCVHGENVPFHCQGGLYWNQNSKNCDWPSNSACDLSGGPDVGGLGVGGGPDSGSSGGDNGSSGMMSTTTYRPTQQQWPSMTTTYRTTQRTTMSTTMRPPMQPTQVVQGQQDPLKGDFMLVCYFTNWAWYRTGEGSYRPNNINENLCTHVVYGFAVLDRTKLTMRVYDSWADLDNKFYEQVVALKAKGIKVSIAIGGWNDSEGDHYSRLVSSPAARTRFTQNVIEFIQRYNFDGLDLDWEYPKCWQVNCDKGPDSDKANFALLVKELKEAFRPYGYLLSAAVSPSKTVIDQGYDVPTLSTYLDWIAVMTYDYHGQWDKKTGHVAPLYFHEEADVSYFNTNYTINYWISQGADRKKIVMGMPLYGQSFTLIDPNNNGLNAPISGGGNQGRYTKQSGFLAYYEICQHIQRDGWTVVQDGSGAMGPYAYRGNQWVSFDDVPMIAKKSQLIRDLNIGGGMVWALDLDDFRNVCGQGEYPLLTTIKNVLSMPRMPMPDRTVPVSSPSTAINNNNFAPGHPHKQQQQQHQQNNPNVINQGQSQSQNQNQNQNQNQVQPKPQPPKRLPGIENQPYLENDVCEDEPYKPHEKDCNKYYQCIFGRYMEQRCPPGTFWNMDRCDWKCGTTPVPGPSGGGGGGTTPKPTMTTPSTMATMTTSRPGSGPVPTMSTPSRPTMTTTRPTTMTPRPTSSLPWPHPSEPVQTTSSPGAPVKPFECPGYGAKPPANLQPWEKPWEPATATETNTASPVNVPASEYKMVCYFTNWAWYRPGIGKYKPSDIDFNLCTHIAYGFAVLDGTSLTIKPHDGWADLENKFYRQVVQLKARGLKVVLAIGGWNDSLGDKYSRLVNNPDARRRFIEHMVEFLEKHCFDGLDLDWEYPKCWQVDCNKGPDSDKQGFSDLVRELSAAFKPRGLLLSSAVSPSKTVIDQGYDVPTISKYMDWISVMTYDYHGQWDKKTGHVAPMYLHEDADNVFFNTNYTINYWISQGADRKKIIMGMPMYGQSFTLVDTKDYGLNAKTSGGGTAGEFTRQSGFLAYYEICRNILSRDWTVVQDESGAIGPYAYKGNQWASFDDMNMIRRKSEYIKEMGLGGGMIWALDLDDFRNTCGCGRHPLLKTINRVLRNYQDPSMDQLTSCRLS